MRVGRNVRLRLPIQGLRRHLLQMRVLVQRILSNDAYTRTPERLLTALSRVRSESVPFAPHRKGLEKREVRNEQHVASIRRRENRRALFRREFVSGSLSIGSGIPLPTG